MRHPGHIRELEDYSAELSDSIRQRVEGQLCKVTSATKESETMYQAASVTFTLISFIVAPLEAKEVLIFVKNPSCRSPLQEDGLNTWPDLVAFFAPREVADQVLGGENVFGRVDGNKNLHIPSPQQLVSAVFTERLCGEKEDEMAIRTRRDRRKQLVLRCRRYLLWLSRHRPSSYLQYGVIINNDSFTLLSIGLEGEASWREVSWKSRNCIQKLCTCVKLIHDEASRPVHPAAPKLRSVLGVSGWAVGVYSVVVGGKQFRLLPIFSGRADGHKTFVALAVSEDHGDHMRVFKYSWYSKQRDHRERAVLDKLDDAPGVVHVDEQLSLDCLETDEKSRKSRSLLVLKKIACPLSACKTVLQFLEAMYDLLEELRYLVQEKKILHRDVSWTNVLINPVDYEGEDARETEDNVAFTRARDEMIAQDDKPGDGIPHKYRFISDIFNEVRQRVRVALADFDHASDLSAGNSNDLKDATGAPMFMASDVLNARGRLHMSYLGPMALLMSTTVSLVLEGCDGKYTNVDEKAAWDDFYKNRIEHLQWATVCMSAEDDKKLKQSFQHGAVHDAESVFYICLLFFVRMWPLDENLKDTERKALEISRGNLFEKLLTKEPGTNMDLMSILDALSMESDRSSKLQPFFAMLLTIGDHLKIPWYNVASTRRGERYEFHLHDFMQRLFLKEIKRMREEGDHVELAEEPLSVRTRVHLSTSQFSDMPVSPLKPQDMADDLDYLRSKKRVKLETGYVSHTGGTVNVKEGDAISNEIKPADSRSNELVVPSDRPVEMPPHVGETMRFPEKFWEIYRWKLQEKSWFSSDNLYS